MDDEDALIRRAQTWVGSVLREKWTLDGLLGVGGMASVYSATHRNGKRGAVKVLHPELSASPDARARFLREGYVANKVGHPGAVSVLDDDTAENGSVFLVMELLEGETVEALAERRPGQRLEPAEVVPIAERVLDVLVAAHAKGIIHRDLKPANVFVTHDDRVMILDFGIARLRDASGGTKTTGAGTTMGTPCFMPPEQARGRGDLIDARTDLWAVGAMMFTLLTGRAVHEGQTVNEVLLAAMTVKAPPVREVTPAVPPALADVVDRALAFDPQDRFQDAGAMQQALRALGELAWQAAPPDPAAPPAGGQAVDASSNLRLTGSPVSRDPAEGRPRSGRTPVIAAAIAGAAVVLVVAFALLQGTGGAEPPMGAAPETTTPSSAAASPTPVGEASEPAIPSASAAPPDSAAPSASAAPPVAAPPATAPTIAPAAAPSGAGASRGAAPPHAPSRTGPAKPAGSTGHQADPLGRW